ncbi:sialic acid-binding Ig-like lectin 5 isoform X2 [Cavia porcellus]|uniref:sialic acid-binding Ig-like lectin 5 isoform X2 n=1 Tax=Cavia porcellus TaxID=10141 RepID=UPI000661E940|nr:sialic acid-binding Ig-like lectin 5 isoform X2 [Cavia porcellus]
MLATVLLLPLLWAGSLQQYGGPYKLQVQKSVTVQEGLCVLVPCSFSYPYHAWPSFGQFYMSWLRVQYTPYGDYPVATNNQRHALQKEIKDRFQLLGNIWTRNCSLSIRGAKMEDTGTYVFRIEQKEQRYYEEIQTHVYVDSPLNLQVTALTEKPVLHIPEPLESGRPTHLSCSLPGSCQGGQPLTFSWLGDALQFKDPGSLYSSVLTLTPRPQDHNTNLTCRVKLRGSQVTTESTSRLSVSYAPQNLSILLFFRNGTVLQIPQNASSLSLIESQPLQLTCAVDSYPPAQLSWFWGSSDLNDSRISSTGILELPCVGNAERASFTCRAQNARGSLNASVSLTMFCAPQLLGPWCSQEAEGLHCSCSSRAWPAPSLGWWLREKLLVGNSSNASFTVSSSSAGPWANSSLTLREGLNSDLRLSCESWNVRGAQRATVLLLPEPGTGAVVGALGGAGAMVLLCLSLFLIFFCIVKARRTQAARRSKRMDEKDPVRGTITWSSKQKSWPDHIQTQEPPVGDALPSQEQQELYYASINFPKMKSCENSPDIRNYETISGAEYEEIKTSK